MGGFASGATPLANGPRHCGQCRNASVLGRTPASPPSAASANRPPTHGSRRSGKSMMPDVARLICGMKDRTATTPCGGRMGGSLVLRRTSGATRGVVAGGGL